MVLFTPSSFRNRRAPKLSIVSGVVKFDIPPTRESFEMYNKSTQTNFNFDEDDTTHSSDASESHNNNTGISKQHGESSLTRSRSVSVSTSSTTQSDESVGNGHTNNNNNNDSGNNESSSSAAPAIDVNSIVSSENFIGFLARTSKIVEKAISITNQYGDVTKDFISAEDAANTSGAADIGKGGYVC